MNDFGKKLLLATTAVMLSLAMAELFLQLFVGPPPRGNMTPVPSSIRITSNLAEVPFLLRPGAQVAHQFPSNPRGYFDTDATLTYRINSLGFRGRETSRRKPAHVFRILGLGDSFTFGTGVRVEDTFLGDLGRRLAAAESARIFEVLNLGVMGFNTAHEVALLREVGVGFEPDIVVICFFANDTQGGGSHSLFRMESSPDGVAFLGRHSLLFDRMTWLLERRRQTSELAQAYRRSFEPHAPGWIAAQEALEAAARLAKQERFQLVLMIFPVLWDLSGSYPFSHIHETVKSFTSRTGIPVLDLLPEFAAYRGPELWVHPTNQHPNETAHSVAGRALFHFLVGQDMLPLAPPEAG